MLITIVIIAVFIYIYMFPTNKNHKNREDTVDFTRMKSIREKYSQLFEYFENKGFTLREINRSEVSIFYITEIAGFVVNVSTSVIFNANQSLQFLVNLNLTEPTPKHLGTRSFIYSATASAKELTLWSEKDIEEFVKSTLENLH
jgi:uncharacterized membrane protein